MCILTIGWCSESSGVPRLLLFLFLLSNPNVESELVEHMNQDGLENQIMVCIFVLFFLADWLIFEQILE